MEPEKCRAQDLEIWIDIAIEKLESNQEPRLRTSDTGFTSVVPTRTVQGLIIFSETIVRKIDLHLIRAF